MLILTGTSLGERQKEINIKVNEAVSKNTNFEDVKTQIENADVDRLFKIDLASKYKNVDYILDILKCGDSLYISRALKCIWLYNNEYSNVINTDYLHHNIFPSMSTKMKKKLLFTISMYVKNERVTPFYTYCMNTKLENIASKFLIFAPESFKLAIINEKQNQQMLQNSENGYLKQFVGNSFSLAESYLETMSECQRIHVLCQLHYLYTVSDVKYLDLLEIYYTTEQIPHSRLGLRISKDILTKHKERIRKNPYFYLTLLNKTMVVKYTTIDDAKLYTAALFPQECSTFWGKDFYGTYNYIIDLIPFEERLQLLKKIFTEKFPEEEFEMSFNFYNLKYYNLMTTSEKEAWALCHINSGTELLGSGRDFMWYKFVSFEKAFVGIKKIILLTSNADSRAEIITVLVESANNFQDLEILFQYYYERHVNEKRHHKERFIDRVLEVHNVYEFGDSCWTAFNKLFYSLDVYSDIGYHGKTEYSMIALIYNIIHAKEVPEVLKKFIDSGIYYYLFKTQTDKLSNENEEVVYQYMLQFYLDSITSVISANDEAKDGDNEKESIRKYILFILDLMFQYKKPKEGIPDIIKKYMMLDWEEFKSHNLFWQEDPKFTQETLLRLLKENTSLLVSELPKLEEKLQHIYSPFKLSILTRKLKVYFSHDVAKVFADFFIQLLTKCDTLSLKAIETAVYGIFELADEKFKTEFIAKFVPTEPKVNHTTIDRKLFYTQQAICRVACYSRPPVPLPTMLMYIKGDYVQYCLPMFNSYLTKLPLPLCIEFTKSIMDTPLSIQKHGLRLAFQCFSLENLTKLILDVWKKTKNVTLRAVIYKSLYTKILKEHECGQKQLLEVLNVLTLDLYEDDCDELFILVTSNDLPAILIADYLETVWKMINKSTNKPAHLERRIKVVHSIINKIDLLRIDFLESIINDHLKTALDEKLVCEKDSNVALIAAKWQLTTKYLVYTSSPEDSAKKVALAQLIFHKCMKMWNKVDEGVYVVRKLCYKFMKDLDNECYDHSIEGMAQGNAIFEQILKDLQDALPLEEIYLTVWDLRLSLICRRILIDRKPSIVQKGDAATLKVIEEGVIDFGKQFANLLNEFIEQRIYYASLLEDIDDILYKRTQRLFEHLNPCKWSNLRIDDAQVMVCSELLEFNIFETYMFALKSLPYKYSDTGCHLAKYKSVISKIKEFGNNEILFFMYEKFNDFKYREYL